MLYFRLRKGLLVFDVSRTMIYTANIKSVFSSRIGKETVKVNIIRHLLLTAILLGLNSYALAFDNFHGGMAVKKLNYDSLFAIAVPLEQSAEGRELIERCIDAYGGESKLQSLESFQIRFKMKAIMNRDSIDVVKSFQRGTKYKIHVIGQVTGEQRVLNGNRAWFANMDTLLVLYSGRYKSELFSYLTLSMPLGIKNERFDSIRYGSRDGDSLLYIYMEKQDTLMIVIGIDPEDHLIKSSEGIIRQGENNFVFINRFSEYRSYEGYLFPHELTNISMGLEVAQSVIYEVDVNVEFDEREFHLAEPLQRGKSY